MSEENQGGAAATAQPGADLGFIGGFGPAIPSSEPMTPAPEEPEAEVAKPAEKPAPVTEEETPLSKLIRSQREDRESRARAEKAASDKDTQIAALAAENAKLKSTDDPMRDPVGWARTQKMSKEEQALFGASLLYDTVPEKAPQDLRFKLFEAKQAREKAAETAAREEGAAKAAQAAQAQQFNAYVASVDAATRAFDAGSYPESEAWYDQDRETYVRSLVATASNMAEAAKRAGKVADLSPGSVATVLEAEIAARMARRDGRRAGATKTQETVTPAVAGKQPVGETMSTKGLGVGAPRPQAMTDEERLKRAAEVAFRTR